MELNLRRKQWTLASDGNNVVSWPIPAGTEVFLAVSLYSNNGSMSFIDEKFPAFYPPECTRLTGPHITTTTLGRVVTNRSDHHDGTTAVLAGGLTVVGDGVCTIRPTTTRWTVQIGPFTEDAIVGVVGSSFDASKHGDFVSVQNCFGYCQRDGSGSDGSGSTIPYGPCYRPGDKIGGRWVAERAGWMPRMCGCCMVG